MMENQTYRNILLKVLLGVWMATICLVPQLINATPIDLSNFSIINVNDGNPDWAKWYLYSGNTGVTQSKNNKPSYFLSDFNVYNSRVEFDAKTIWGDDDTFGFVWGFQDINNFYQFVWNGYTKPRPSLGGVGKKAGGVWTKFDSMTDPWNLNTMYHFTLDFEPGFTSLLITRGTNLVKETEFYDSTFADGKFGFYTGSQTATFRNLEITPFQSDNDPVPEPGTINLIFLGILGLAGTVRLKKNTIRN